MTLQQIMSQATTALGNRLELAVSQLSLQANLAQEEVAAMLPHTELLKTATLVLGAGSSATVIPADFGELVDVSRPNSFDAFGHRLLTLVALRQIDDAPDSTGTATGVSNRFAISANSILFYPGSTSIDTFTMRYVAVPSDMTNLTDRPSLHTRYHSAVAYKLTENMADLIVDNPRAAYYRNKFVSVMGTLPTPSDTLNRSERTL
jgi:hypothetical protein